MIGVGKDSAATARIWATFSFECGDENIIAAATFVLGWFLLVSPESCCNNMIRLVKMAITLIMGKFCILLQVADGLARARV